MIKSTRPLAYWLFVCAVMVWLMAIIGAATRLTESGLSIVDWRPVSGIMPPLSDSDWAGEFAKYQTSPQYQQVNRGMELAEFKKIYWWEWVHRFWGRLIGLVFAVPLAFFWLRKMIPADYKLPMLGVLALGGSQGVLGWAMVASGLVDEPAVSHYRLASHLILAAIIYATLLWFALKFWRFNRLATPVPAGLRKHAIAMLCVLLITMFWGSMVAGLRAGLIYNEFPLMGGQVLPPEMWHMQPVWLNFFANHAAVQFTHRCLGILTALMGLGLATRGWFKVIQPSIRKLSLAIGATALIQASFGVVTLLSQVQLHVAVAHQAVAFVLLGLLVAWLRLTTAELPLPAQSGTSQRA